MICPTPPSGAIWGKRGGSDNHQWSFPHIWGVSAVYFPPCYPHPPCWVGQQIYYKENNNMNNYKQRSRAATTEGHFPHQSLPMGCQYVDHSTTFPPCAPQVGGVGHIIDRCITASIGFEPRFLGFWFMDLQTIKLLLELYLIWWTLLQSLQNLS